MQPLVLSPSERVLVTAGPLLVGPSPHRSGRGVLEVRWVAGQSAATSVWAESPLKLLVPRSRGTSVWAYLSSFGGGLVAGDETSFDVSVGLGARCFVGSQASTKVYRNPTQRPCTHEVVARVAAGAMLIYAPDPVQCFADSRYHQRQSFYLEPGSDLMVLDGLSGGRAACGERWAFSHLSSRNEVFWDHQPLWLDALRLDPAEGSLSSSARLGRFNSMATVVWFGDRLKPMSEAVLNHFSGAPIGRRASVVASASRIRQGALLRVAGVTTESIVRLIAPFLTPIAELLGDDPWARKG